MTDAPLEPLPEALDVTFRSFLAGRLSATVEGLAFSYEPRWLRTRGAVPLSMTMPLREAPYPDAAIAPWIQNLLPEADVGKAFARALGLSIGDAYGLLKAAGADTAGAFSFGPPEANASGGGSYVPVFDYMVQHGEQPKDEDEALGLLLDGLFRKPFFADEDGVRLSLAGGQVKTALAAIDARGQATPALYGDGVGYAVPHGPAGSTLIVKPDNPHLLGIVENEAYCLELARLSGLVAVEWSILKAGRRLALLVARYDRKITPRADGTTQVNRIHQEDFCQLLGLPPQRKYETATGAGATMRDLFATARAYLGPRDQLRFLDYVIFNILVGNTDAHAKNYSVLIHPEAAALAPLYDVNSVLAWRHINQRHAQKIAGKPRKPVDIARRHWEVIASEAGLNARELIRRVDNLATRAVGATQAARQPVLASPGTTPAIVDDIATRIDEHICRIQGRL